MHQNRHHGVVDSPAEHCGLVMASVGWAIIDDAHCSQECKYMLNRAGDMLSEALKKDGFAFIPSWSPDSNTHQVAEFLGKIIKLSEVSNKFNIKTVQALEPRHKQAETNRVYSDIFGLGKFPLHTDLAYWQEPPHYLILRCLRGSSEVHTRILNVAIVEQMVGELVMKRALVKARHLPHNMPVCVLPLRPTGLGNNCIRWDSVFLKPVNGAASHFFDVMARLDIDTTLGVNVPLVNQGDTLVIDNWRVLHGRSSVPSHGEMRRIERVFLSALH
jgi:L-asparagine oxygenase